jgi:hypothetical protein
MAEAFLAWYKPVEGVEAQFEVWSSKRFPHHGRNHSGVVGVRTISVCFTNRAIPYLATPGQLLTSLYEPTNSLLRTHTLS